MGKQDTFDRRGLRPDRQRPHRPRRLLGRRPTSRLVHVRDLLTAEELKTSPTCNEMLRRTGGQGSLNARLDGTDGSSITWGLRRPRRRGRLVGLAGHDGHESAAHIRQVRPRPAGARTGRGAGHDRDRSCSTTRGSASFTWTGAGGSSPPTTAPASSCGTATVDGPGRDAGRPRAGRPGPA